MYNRILLLCLVMVFLVSPIFACDIIQSLSSERLTYCDNHDRTITVTDKWINCLNEGNSWYHCYIQINPDDGSIDTGVYEANFSTDEGVDYDFNYKNSGISMSLKKIGNMNVKSNIGGRYVFPDRVVYEFANNSFIEYVPSVERLKENIVLSKEDYASNSDLTLEWRVKGQKNIDIYANGQLWTDQNILGANTIEMRWNGETILYFEKPYVQDQSDKFLWLSYDAKILQNQKFITLTVPQSWLSTTVGRIYIDPTTTTTAQSQGFVVADATTDQYNSASNYNTIVEARTTTTNNANRRWYIGINFSSIFPNIGRIDSAKLYLYESAYTSGSASVNLQTTYCNSLFNEATLTWNNKDTQVTSCDASPTTDVVMTSYSVASQFYSFDYTTATTDEFDDGDGVFTIKAKMNPESFDGSSRTLTYRYRGYVTTNQRPYFEITYEDYTTDQWILSANPKVAGFNSVFATWVNDTSGLDSYKFSFDNGTGSFVNDSWVHIDMTGLGSRYDYIQDSVYVKQNNPTNTYGTLSGGIIRSDDVSKNGRSYTLINTTNLFNAIQDKYVINSTLYLYYDYFEVYLAGQRLYKYYCDDSFTPSTLTWNNQLTEVTGCEANPSINVSRTYLCGSDFCSPAGWKTHDISQMVKLERDGGDNLFTLRERFMTEDANPTNYITWPIQSQSTSYSKILTYYADATRWINVTKQLNSTVGTEIKYRLWWNDTLGAVHVTDTYYFNTLPEISVTSQDYNLIQGTTNTLYVNSTLNHNKTGTANLYLIYNSGTPIFIDDIDCSSGCLQNANYQDSYNLVLPSSDAVTKQFYFVLNWTNSPVETYTSDTYDITITNQTVITGGDQLCLAFKNETNQAVLTMDKVEAIFDIIFEDGGTTRYSYTNTTITNICYQTGLNESVIVDARFQYSKGGFAVREYFLYHHNMSESNKLNLTLYSIPTTGSTGISFKINDNLNLALPDAYISAQRFYTTSNSYHTVAMGLSDPNGETRIYLAPNDVYYVFTITYQGDVVFTSEPMLVIGSTISFSVNPSVSLGLFTFENIDYTVTFNNATKTWRATVSDPSLSFNQICMEVKRTNLYGTSRICYSCSSGVSMILTCTDASYDEDNNYYVSLIGTGSEQMIYGLSQAGYKWAGGVKTLLIGASGSVLALFLIIGVVASSLFSPILAIILGVIGLFVAVAMSLVVLSIGAITGLAIAGAIIIWRMTR